MRHGKKFNKLGRTASHRKSLLINQASSLFIHGYIKTTLAKAKALRPFAEKLITRATKIHKANTLTSRLTLIRTIASEIANKKAYEYLVGVWGAHCANRPGGYLRIVKMGPRLGDGAEMALIGIVMDEKLAKQYNLYVPDVIQTFRNFAEVLLLDRPLPKEVLKLWSYAELPEPIVSLKQKDERTLDFAISFAKIGNPDQLDWPIYSGAYLDLPLTVTFRFSSSRNKKINIQRSVALVTIPIFYEEDQQLRILLSPFKDDQFIFGSIYSKNGLKDISYAEVIIYSPVGKLFSYDLLLKRNVQL